MSTTIFARFIESLPLLSPRPGVSTTIMGIPFLSALHRVTKPVTFSVSDYKPSDTSQHSSFAIVLHVLDFPSPVFPKVITTLKTSFNDQQF